MIYPELEDAETIGRKDLFERRSIEKNARRGIDPLLLERSLHCLEYVAQMHANGLEFVFKGGTACQLLVGREVQRLSIDIDISTNASEEEVREVLRAIHSSAGDKTYRPTLVPKKGLDKVPLLMFNISAPTYYPQQKQETMIKLDVVLKMPAYETTMTSLTMFHYDSGIKVRTPSTGSMLGDKLSTLGPNTIGIGADLPVDNIKQFYDIGSLLARDYDINDVRKAYRACFREVSSWRELSISLEEALEDLVEWCKVASAVQNMPQGAEEGRMAHIRNLARGIDGFTGYIASENLLTRRRLREVASRAALLARLIQERKRFGILLDFIRRPAEHQDVILHDFNRIQEEMKGILVGNRWHIHMKEFRNNPLAMAAWYGYWYPEELAELLVR